MFFWRMYVGVCCMFCDCSISFMKIDFLNSKEIMVVFLCISRCMSTFDLVVTTFWEAWIGGPELSWRLIFLEDLLLWWVLELLIVVMVCFGMFGSLCISVWAVLGHLAWALGNIFACTCCFAFTLHIHSFLRPRCICIWETYFIFWICIDIYIYL